VDAVESWVSACGDEAEGEAQGPSTNYGSI
jgi:hypothetical protein